MSRPPLKQAQNLLNTHMNCVPDTIKSFLLIILTLPSFLSLQTNFFYVAMAAGKKLHFL